MVRCSAPNCQNSTEDGFRMFRFPSNPARRELWRKHCRRDAWIPTPSNRLCEIHFDADQFENHRADGWKKLKPTAVPTKFNFCTSKPLKTQKENKQTKGVTEELATNSSKIVLQDPLKLLTDVNNSLNRELAETRQELLSVKRKLGEQQQIIDKLNTFLNADQISAVGKKIQKWSDESNAKAIRLRFALGIYGYDYLRSTHYPAPSYTRLLKKTRNVESSFGVLRNVLSPLKYKVESFGAKDRFCVLGIGEMKIAAEIDFDEHITSYGNATIGDDLSVPGNRLLVIMLNGIQTPWKQIVASEVITENTPVRYLKQTVEECIKFAKECGLRVVAVSVEKTGNIGELWDDLNMGTPETTSNINGHDMYKLPDAHFLLKELKKYLLTAELHLPEDTVAQQGLHSNVVNGEHLKTVWKRSHLRKSNHALSVCPASSVFSTQTADALQIAVDQNALKEDALTTAYFCELLSKWFAICASKTASTSISRKTLPHKKEVLRSFVEVMKNISIDPDRQYIQSGLIMCTRSMLQLSEELIKNGFRSVITYRCSQDSLETVFKRIRRRTRKLPNARQCAQMVKTIALSQLEYEVIGPNYDFDFSLYPVNDLPESRVIDEPSESLQETTMMEEIEINELEVSDFICVSDDMPSEEKIFRINGTSVNPIEKQNLCKINGNDWTQKIF